MQFVMIYPILSQETQLNTTVLDVQYVLNLLFSVPEEKSLHESRNEVDGEEFKTGIKNSFRTMLFRNISICFLAPFVMNLQL